MIIFGNVGRTDILAWSLLLYTKKLFLQKITFPFFRYHLPIQQLPKIAEFQISADFCRFRHFCRKSNPRDKTGFPRKGSKDPFGILSPGNSDKLFENKQSLRCGPRPPTGGAGRGRNGDPRVSRVSMKKRVSPKNSGNARILIFPARPGKIIGACISELGGHDPISPRFPVVAGCHPNSTEGENMDIEHANITLGTAGQGRKPRSIHEFCDEDRS